MPVSRPLFSKRWLNMLGVLAASFLLGSILSAEPAGKRYAIVVGVNEYLDSGILKLATPRNDAQDLAATLRGLAWDKVFVLSDDADARSADFPTRGNIEKRVNLLAELAGTDDTVLLFFSGHGVSQDGEDSFLPVDADLNRLKDSGLVIGKLVKSLSAQGITKVVLAVDACRESVTKTKGLSVVGVAGKADVASSAAMTGGTPALALYATQAGWYSYEDKGGRNGVFTKFLIDGLKGQAAAAGATRAVDISAADLARWLPATVAGYALDQGIRQKPIASVAGSGADGIILGHGSTQAATASPVSPVVAKPSFDPVKKGQYNKFIEQAMDRLNRGDLSGARYILDQAIKLLPGEGEAFFQYARSFEIAKDPGKAYEWYSKAMAVKPDMRNLNAQIARMLVWLQLADDAVPYFEQELKLYPDNWWAAEIYGDMLVHVKGDPASLKKAIPVLQQGITANSKDAYLYQILGDAHWQLGDKVSMADQYRLAIAAYKELLKDLNQRPNWIDYGQRIADMQKEIDVSQRTSK